MIPRSALSLESLGDTVYVAVDGVASRREVELGFREGDLVEVVSGLAAGDPVVVVGQDGLSDGTPVQVLASIALDGNRRGDGGGGGGKNLHWCPVAEAVLAHHHHRLAGGQA